MTGKITGAVFLGGAITVEIALYVSSLRPVATAFLLPLAVLGIAMLLGADKHP